MFFTCQEFWKNNKKQKLGVQFWGKERDDICHNLHSLWLDDWNANTHNTHTAFYKVDGKWELGQEMETFWKGHYTLKDTRLRGVVVKGCVCVCVCVWCTLGGGAGVAMSTTSFHRQKKETKTPNGGEIYRSITREREGDNVAGVDKREIARHFRSNQRRPSLLFSCFRMSTWKTFKK